MSDIISDTAQLASDFKGETIAPGDPGYDRARAMYSRSIDRRPSLIVRPSGAADVIDAVNYARENSIQLAVRCGGHSVAGTSICEGGLLLDLSSLKGVLVEPDRKTAHAEAGVLWGEYDRETQLYGLATPGGRVTTTGVGGFTLGGGYGWLSPKYGLTCDNLVSAEVVTADGRLVHVSEDENPDLLWGLRGAGANFGVVTSYELKLHRVGPTLLAGMLLLPNEDLGAVMRACRDYIESAPEELITSYGMVLAPAAPFVPEQLVGTPVWGLIVAYIGDPDEGQGVVAPLRELTAGGIDLVEPTPYTAFQTILDGFNPKGLLNYHRGIHMRSLPDEVIDSYLAVGKTIGSPTTQGVIFRHGGAVSRVPDDATAAGNRSAPYMGHPIAAWSSPEETDREMDWVDRFSQAMGPATTGGVYLNFEPSTDTMAVKAGYGEEKYRRLVALKDSWDPTNLFRSNHNIAPTGWTPPS
ncbi:MAG: FAD-binding oxidoreductase [Nocardioidaceae bacterium]